MIKRTKVRVALAKEIFDRLYFGDSNILVVGESGCLQELCRGGVRMLKHKYLVRSVENFIERFNNLAFEYTDGQCGTKKGGLNG